MTDEGNLTFSTLGVSEIDKKASTVCLLLPLNTFYICNVAMSAFNCQVQSFCFYC